MEEMLAECPPLSLKSRFFLHSLFFFAQSSFLFLNNPPQTASCPNKEPEEDSAEAEAEVEVEATDEATTRSRRGDR
jgi:hypothetical protein